MSTHNLNPSARTTIILGVLLTVIWSAVYLVQPDFIEGLQFKLTDTIVAGAAETGITDKVAVVDIDEQSLKTWGQWPWPRSQLATLLNELAGMGPRCIALDFIMAEPDRTSPKTLHEELKRELGLLENGGDAPPTLPDNDVIMAATLSGGPFVLGYEFHFEDNHRNSAGCHLYPLELIDIQQPANGAASLTLHQAQGAVCNIDQLARAAPHSGFLNGRVDGDGRLRRLPLVIRYGQSVYPNLALAALLPTVIGQPAKLKQRAGDQSSLILGDHSIPIDHNGNLRIRFADKQSTLRHISANRVLTGQVDESEIKNRMVFVGLSASGLASAYQTPAGGLFTAVEVHAQALETILSNSFIYRHTGIVLAEVILSMMVALLYSLCIARLEFVTTTAIGAAGIVLVAGGAQLLFNSRQVLLSPLLPAAVIISCGLFLMLFKYWTRQRKARHRLQDALILMRSSQKDLNAIIETIPDIVFRLDASGRITFISPALAKYKKQPEELIGKPILDLVIPKDRDLATYRINERRTGDRATTDLEVRLMLSPTDGEENSKERVFSVSAQGIYAKASPDAASFSGTQGIARDINDRKHLENKLEQSKKMEAMGNLAAGVAHDLNNILSGLVSYPELLLLDLPPDSPMRDSIKTIQRSGQRAADIVQDMLMIARRGVKNFDIINFNDAICGYLTTPEFKNLAGNHPNIRVSTDLADDLMNVKGSSVHISKVIMNLVGNAAEAMPAGGTICLFTRNRYLDTAIDRYERIPEGEYVMLGVTDEGVGIPPEELHRIFEPFYSKKRMGRSGSGLGMTVVWNTIKDHAGFVDIHSREGDGTRFNVLLPATREEENGTKRRVVLQDYTGTERILVVDDIPEQLEIAVRMLSRLGYQIASASGGAEAVAHVQANPVDLLVLDMVMPPGIDGLETYRRILDVRPGQKAIIASGYAPSDRVKAMQEMGAGVHIRKPYTMEKIGLAVRRELDRK
ncbi:CHASE2 domain-containing protein [Desulfosarcina sp.]|uniref:CHASE2 domain-containing protein n=1 Tax=Desulfosarcina sp. TaxID=2027861 RepID=UPI0029B25B45|nr:CHASE2 domain-containing protein [Desulfosarcina sp.]MDX2454215.1 CHASE2 domain-containing protein [Desulfosarcina sp.]